MVEGRDVDGNRVIPEHTISGVLVKSEDEVKYVCWSLGFETWVHALCQRMYSKEAEVYRRLQDLGGINVLRPHALIDAVFSISGTASPANIHIDRVPVILLHTR